jgi:hypothetical protein
MAGDWMKIELDTPDKPEVVAMAARLRLDQDEILGKLFRIWAWADRNSVDGSRMFITRDFLDRLTRKRGFANAMESVGWLVEEDGMLTFPGFERHNGKSAKARAESNRRMTKTRELRKCCNKSATKSATPSQQKAQPEKRREEKSIRIPPQPPIGGASGAEDAALIGKIKSLRKRWGEGPALDAKDARIFRKNRIGWSAYGADDWPVVQMFLLASLPQGSPDFQPEKLGKALEMPTELLASARSWMNKRRDRCPPKNVVPMPEQTAEDKAAVAEFLKGGIMGGGK